MPPRAMRPGLGRQAPGPGTARLHAPPPPPQHPRSRGGRGGSGASTASRSSSAVAPLRASPAPAPGPAPAGPGGPAQPSPVGAALVPSAAAVPAARPDGTAAAQHESAPTIAIRVAGPDDAAALAALDASGQADGSSGWSEALYRADLAPGGPNLILLAELTRGSHPAPAGAHPQQQGGQGAAAAPRAAGGPPPAPATTTPHGAGGGGGAGRVVGLAAGCCVPGIEASLTNLAVCRSLRGRGLGRRLAVALLRQLGSESLPTVLEVREDNRTAQALYVSMDFAVVGRRKRYNADGTDSLVLVREPGPLG